MYILHLYIEKNERLHVVNDERKYNDIVNSSNSFFLELEELKSCMYYLEMANAGIKL